MEIHVLPTRAGTDMLELALRSEGGNPWPLIGMGQRGGGAKSRMFAKLKADGYFDANNSITLLGKNAFILSAKNQRISIGRRTVKRMVHYPEGVDDGTYRCITCGQIDDEPYHMAHVCQAAHDCIYGDAR